MSELTPIVGPILDWWAWPHLAFFAFLGSTIAAVWVPKLWIHITICLFISFGWETIEHFISREWPASWGYYLEHPINAWIIDPISNGIGYTTGALVGIWSRNRIKKRTQR